MSRSPRGSRRRETSSKLLRILRIGPPRVCAEGGGHIARGEGAESAKEFTRRLGSGSRLITRCAVETHGVAQTFVVSPNTRAQSFDGRQQEWRSQVGCFLGEFIEARGGDLKHGAVNVGHHVC